MAPRCVFLWHGEQCQVAAVLPGNRMQEFDLILIELRIQIAIMHADKTQLKLKWSQDFKNLMKWQSGNACKRIKICEICIKNT